MQNVTMNWDNQSSMNPTLDGGKANPSLSGIHAEVECACGRTGWNYKVIDLYTGQTIAKGFSFQINWAKENCERVVSKMLAARKS